MPFLSQKRILELHGAALDLGLENARATLLGGMPRVLSGLATSPKPSEQLLLDLIAMNSLPSGEAGEACALEQWLATAVHLHRGDPRTAVLESILEEVKGAREARGVKGPPLMKKTGRWGRWLLLVGVVLLGCLGIWLYLDRSRCGNGRLDAGESCDDGNGVSGDGCSGGCVSELMLKDGGTVDAGGVDSGGVDSGAADSGAADGGGMNGGPGVGTGLKARVSCKAGTVEMYNGPRESAKCGLPPGGAVPPKDFPRELEWTAPGSPPGVDPPWKCRCSIMR